MKSMKTILCILLLLSLVICLIGCNSDHKVQLDLTPVKDQDAVTLYEAACNTARDAAHLKLNMIATKTITISQSTYQDSYIQSLSYTDYGKDSMRAHNSTIRTSGENRIYLEEFYENGTVYTAINDSRFCSDMGAADYANRFLPAVLLCADNYQTVHSQSSATGTLITFADAITAEAWCNIDADSFTGASGYATLDANGHLTETSYSLSYSYEGMVIYESFTTRFNTIQADAVKQVDAPESYLHIEDAQLPVQLEIAAGYLAQANFVSSFIQETSVSQATGMHYNFTTQVQMANANTALRASTTYESTLIDYSRDGESTTTHESEEFANGEYTFKDSEGNIQTDPSVNDTVIKDHIQKLLIQNIATPDQICSATATATATTETLEFTLDEEVAQHLKAYACDALSMDDSLLDSLAQAYETEYTTGTLTVDRLTGLPAELSVRYSGVHIIEGQAYQLTYELKQTFSFDISY